ncbi:hypothetical protein [Goodfellowiella coeruleoviolacea]|uniref:Uncharacterized protein n=1 Tax=Goodfellowiella coeruleoviolacea TaxID=334858 RepID=A0AAE3GJ33_9PSEU|nr:hypothetical protein [Goodfellowiella coeruleoviolacea]MCP2169141.1 hypothetical protein [Goodfellowiella coeruleoviolacea]
MSAPGSAGFADHRRWVLDSFAMAANVVTSRVVAYLVLFRPGMVVDPSAFHRVTGWRAEVGLLDGLERMVRALSDSTR